jgi:hypothetical protein
MEKIKTTLYLPIDLHNRVKAEAARRGWTVTYLVNELLKDWMRRHAQRPPEWLP